MKIKIARTMGAGLTATGVVEVDGDTLHFRTTGVVGALLRKQSFSVSVLDIATLQWHRRSSQVVLTTTFDETVTLQGPNGARLAVALWAKGVGRADPSRLSGAQVYYEGQATYVSGPMHFRGRIAIGDHGLFWESTGSVEQLVGVSGLRLPVDEVSSAEPLSDGASVTAADGTVSRFLVPESDLFVSTLVAQFHKTVPDVDPDESRGEAALFFPAVLRTLDSKVTSQGTVTVTREGTLLATPLSGPPLEVHAATVQVLAYDNPDDHLQTLELPTLDQKTLRIVPQGGQAGIRALLEFSRSLPVVDAVTPSDHRLLKPVVGALESVRTEGQLGEELSIRLPTVVHLERTLGLLRPRDNDWSSRVGTRVRLLLGTGRHIVEVTARYLGVETHTAEEGLKGWPQDRERAELFSFAVLHEEAVKVLPTRRETYRVPSIEPIAVTPKGAEEPLDGRMYNLSLGGCGFLLREQHELGARFRVALQLNDGPLEVELEVVFTESMREEGTRFWRHGSRFRNLQTMQSTRLAREVTLREIRGSQA